jgi:hypothetical protein
MHHWLTNEWYKFRVAQKLFFHQEPASRTKTILSGIDRYAPVTFARATNGYVYMASGLAPVMKWDGVKHTAIPAGVPAPTQAVTIAGMNPGTIDGTYTAYLRFLDADDNPSNLSPVSTEISVTDVAKLVYTNVQVPTDKRVRRRQLLRNTSGQALTYYVDIDTADLFSTTFTSTKDDNALSLEEAVPLFDDEGRSIATRFGVPPNDKPIIVFYNGRLLMGGEIVYEQGHIEVTNGSASAVGIGTAFDDAMIGRFLYVVGGSRTYEISAVNEATQTLTLLETYRDATDLFAPYAIRSPPAQRTLLYFSEAGQFDAWPATNAFDVGGSDDLEEEVTGLVSTQSFIYVVQRRHIYRVSYHEDPLVDGGAFMAARRGCVNNRCWVHVDGWTYMLDDRGIHRFDGSDAVEDLSWQVQDLFWLDRLPGELRVNWSAYRLFHASHHRDQATIRWFVAFSGDYMPRHAICYSYKVEQFWIEEYASPIGASELIKLAQPISAVASSSARAFALAFGQLDVTDSEAGDTRGIVDDSGPMWISDADATWPTAGVVGAPVAIVAGRGKGQVRSIYAASAGRLWVTQPWLVQPDDTSTYQIGAVAWKWSGSWLRWVRDEDNQPRRVTVHFQPLKRENEADVRIFTDYNKEPDVWALDWPTTEAEGDGVVLTADSPDAVANLTQNKGFVQLRLDDWSELSSWQGERIAVELRGFSGRDPVRIYEINVEGAVE